MRKIINWFWNILEIVAIACLKVLFRILHKELTPEIEANFMQFVKFCVVGVSNTIVAWVLLTAIRLPLEAAGLFGDYAYLIANILSWILSVAWSFFWNNKYVFKVGEGEERSIFKALIKTYISYSFTGLFLSNIILMVLVEVFGMSKLLAPLANAILCLPINFVINRFWAFKKER